MRDFILKWKAVIIWVIAVVFTAGIIWWGVASYIDIGGNTSQQQYTPEEYVPSRTEALAVITKESTDLNHAYWLMPYELSERMQEITDYYRDYGQEIDELFQGPYLELNTAKSLIDNKIVEYYADENALSPTEEEVNAQIEAVVAQNINTDEIKQLVIQRYGSLDNYKAYIKPFLVEQLKRDNVKAKVTEVTEEDMKTYFEENKEDITSGNNQVKASHILVNEKALAEDILKQIQDGEITFSEAAVKYSTDQSNSENGGELGWFSRGEMVQPFEEAAFNAEVGTIVGPVETDYGYHLIDVQDRKKLETYEDFVNNEEVYNNAKTQLANEKFDAWLETYKAENEFDYILNDDVLNVYDKYQAMTNNSEKTDNETINEFVTWLEQFIIVEDEGIQKLDARVDPRNIALYVSSLEEMNNNFTNQETILKNFQSVADNTRDEYMSMNVEKLDSLHEVKEKQRLSLEDEVVMIEEKMAETGNATETSDNKAYLENLNQQLSAKKAEMQVIEDEISQIEDAKKYHDLVEQLAEQNIQPTQVDELLMDIEEEIQANESRIVEGLNILYDTNTTSKQVVNMLRKYEPDNSEVALKWFQQQIGQYMMYLNDEEIFKQYRMILEPQLLQYQLGLAKIAQSDEEPVERRVSAYETLLNLMEKWGKLEEEVMYLKELQELKPDYPDIDLIIQQVQETIGATETTESTSTQ
ncbi:MAG: peptidylprolyl isomerase [Thermotogota bacterium]|nr:peptidylprolyl isomerase [Thermotogota bacterium]